MLWLLSLLLQGQESRAGVCLYDLHSFSSESCVFAYMFTYRAYYTLAEYDHDIMTFLLTLVSQVLMAVDPANMFLTSASSDPLLSSAAAPIFSVNSSTPTIPSTLASGVNLGVPIPSTSDIFTPLVRRPVLVVPAGIDSYMDEFMAKEEFMAYFEERNISDARLSPAPIKDGFVAPSGFMGEIHSLLLSATDRLAYSMESLFKLVENMTSGAPVTTQEITGALKLIAVGASQSYVQQLYIRRFMILEATWKNHSLSTIRDILKKATSSTKFDATVLFGPEFAEHVKNYSTLSAPPAAPSSSTAVDLVPRANSRRRFVGHGSSRGGAGMGSSLSKDSSIVFDSGSCKRSSCDQVPHAKKRRKLLQSTIIEGTQRSRPPPSIAAASAPSPVTVTGNLSPRDVGVAPIIQTSEASPSDLQPFRQVARHGVGSISTTLVTLDQRPDHSLVGLGGTSRSVPLANTAPCSGDLPIGGTGSSNLGLDASGSLTPGHNKTVSRSPVLLWSVLNPQTRAKQIPSNNRPVGPKLPLHSIRAFSDGEPIRCSGDSGEGGLHVQGGLEKRLLFSAYSQGASGPPSFHVEGGTPHVYSSLFWSSPGSKNFYQNSKACYSLAEVPGRQADSISGRFLDSSSLPGEVQIPHQETNDMSNQLGVHSKSAEEHYRASAESDLFRHDHLVSRHDGVSPSPKERQTALPDAGDEAAQEHIVSHDGQTPGGSGGHQTRLQHGSTIFQTTTSVASGPPGEGRNPFNGSVVPEISSVARVGFLDRPSSSPQTSTNPFIPGLGSPNGNRCIQHGLGCNTRGQGSSRQVGSGRESQGHKFQGTDGSLERDAGVCQSSTGSPSSGRLRQSLLPSLHSENGRCEECSAVSASHQGLGVCSVSISDSDDRLHPRGGEHTTRLPVSCSPDREYRVAAEQETIPAHRPEIRSTETGPICKSLESPAPGLLHMEGVSRPEERISDPVGRSGLPVSSIRSPRQGSPEDQSGPLPSGTSSTTVASTALVQPSAEHVQDNAPPELLSSTAPGPTREPTSSREVTETSGMGRRRSHWSSLGVPEEVQDFLLEGELA